MLLRTGNAELRRVNSVINDLIEEIRENLEYSNEDRVSLEALLSRVTKPLSRVETKGNYDVLYDSLDLYDSAIKRLEKIIQDRQYSDEKPVTDIELATFEVARDILQDSKSNGKGLVKAACDELGEQYKSGQLEKEFYQYRAANSKDIKDIDNQMEVYKKAVEGSDAEIDKQEEEIEQLGNGLKALDIQLVQLNASKVYPTMFKEVAAFKKSQATKKQLEQFSKEIAEVEKKLQDPKVPAKDRTNMLSERAVLVLRREEALTKVYPQEMGKVARTQGEDSAVFYSKLEKEFAKICQREEVALRAKVTTMLDKKIWAPVLDTATKKLNMAETEFRTRYFPGKPKDAQISADDLSKFIGLLEKDDREIQQLIDENNAAKKDLKHKKDQAEKKKEALVSGKKREQEKLDELTEKRTEKLEEIADKEQRKTQEDEYNRIAKLSKFDMWKQRMAFRFSNRGMLFASRKVVEAEMIKKKVANAKLKVDPNEILSDLEKRRKQFRADLQNDVERDNTKQAMKDTAKQEVFRRWDSQRDESQR